MKMKKMRVMLSLMLAVVLFVLPLSVYANDFETPVQVIDGVEMVWNPSTGKFEPTDVDVENITIEVTLESNQKTTALVVGAETADSSVTVDGNVSKEDYSCAEGDKAAVSVDADNEFTASATIIGDVSSYVEVEDDRHDITMNDAVYLSSSDGSTAVIDVKGSVSSESSASGSGADANASAVHTLNDVSGEGRIDVTVGKDAVAKATADDQAFADSVYVSGFGINNVHITGNAIAEASSVTGKAYANGIRLNPDAVGSTTIIVDKNVEVSAESSKGATAIGLHANSNTGNADIHVKGDVKSEIKSVNYGEGFDNYAIGSFTENGASVKVTVDGKAIAESTNSRVYNQAVHAGADGDKSLTDITIGSAEGTVDLQSSNGGTIKMTVSNGIVADDVGVAAMNSGGMMDITVNGSIDTRGGSIGFLSQSIGAEAVTNLNLNSNISNESETVGYGLLVTVADQGKVKATITGDSVSSKVVDDSAEESQASGMIISNAGGDIDIYSVTDFSASGADFSSGVNVNSSGETVYSVDESSDPVAIVPKDADYTNTVLVDGVETDVYWFGEDGYVSSGEGLYSKIIGTQIIEEGSTNLSVTGNVTGDQYGLELDIRKEQTAEIIVDGTVAGKESAVLIGEETDIGDNVKLTVWQMTPNKKDGALVHTMGEDGNLSEDLAAEKEIQYIIRVNAEQKDIISAAGTTEYEGFQVAKEGETVTLKLDIPYGYEISEAYGDVGQQVKLLKDANGNYYLVVPRGGAVELSVKLKEKVAPVPDFPAEHQSINDLRFDVQTNDNYRKTNAIDDKATYGTLPEDDSILWLREESAGKAAWYGFDNSDGALPSGSIISVHWIGKEEEMSLFTQLQDKVDSVLAQHDREVEKDRDWIFELNAYKKGGGLLNNAFANDAMMKVYVEIGEDWDADDINTIWLDQNQQEGELWTVMDVIEQEVDGVRKRFAVLNLEHFSFYAIADTMPIEEK